MATIKIAQTLPRYDVRCIAGRPLELTVPVLQGGGSPMPAAQIDAARAHVRLAVDDPTVLHGFGSDDEPADIAISDGQLVLTATSETTSLWGQLWPGVAPETVAWWDVEITDGDGETWQITEPGQFVVVHQVTR